MELKIFFDTLDPALSAGITDPNALGNIIEMHTEKFPKWRHANFAIIGLSEDRGQPDQSGVVEGADAIRKALYKLKKGQGNYKIVDLGNLRCGVKLEDSYLRLKEVCEVLMREKVFPLLIGSSHDMDLGQYMAYEACNRLISVLNVDSVVDLSSIEAEAAHKKHTHKILVHEPNYLFNFTNLAYQSYLNDHEAIAVLEKLYFDHYRLGQLRDNFQEIEPVIRQADMLSFDITAIKMQDSPANIMGLPFGLSGEEACQICWYAGISEKLTSAGFYGFNPELDFRDQSASVISTMMWYLIDGYYHRQHELDFESDHFTKYTVTLEQQPHKLVFYKSRKTEKWWMVVPYPETDHRYAANTIVPCSYSDYLVATDGEVPLRWINMHAKLI